MGGMHEGPIWPTDYEAGDLRRYCAHYDVTVMSDLIFIAWNAIYFSSFYSPFFGVILWVHSVPIF